MRLPCFVLRYLDEHNSCLLIQAASKCLKLALCCFQVLETFMGLGINLVSVSMNYTAPAEAIYNIVLSKPTPFACPAPCTGLNGKVNSCALVL